VVAVPRGIQLAPGAGEFSTRERGDDGSFLGRTKQEMNLDKRRPLLAIDAPSETRISRVTALSLTGCDGIVGPSTSRDHGQQHDASQQPQSISRGSRDTLDTLLTDHRGTG